MINLKIRINIDIFEIIFFHLHEKISTKYWFSFKVFKSEELKSFQSKDEFSELKKYKDEISGIIKKN